jgi:hypothetical protein
LALPLLRILRESLASQVDITAWTSLSESLARTQPEEAADLLSDELTSNNQARVALQGLTLKTLEELAHRVFEEFCTGRHNFEMRWGNARDRRVALERELAPILALPEEWVRRWAEWELRFNEDEARVNERMDDRSERM